MIHVLASIRVKSGRRDEFLSHFNRNVPNVLAEDGCHGYVPAVDIESGISVQGRLREDLVTVIEQWESLEHLHAHLKAPHMDVYREQVKDLVEDVALQVLTPAL